MQWQMFYICFGNLRSVSGAETEIVTAGLDSRLSDVRKYRYMPMKLKSIPVCHINLRNYSTLDVSSLVLPHKRIRS